MSTVESPECLDLAGEDSFNALAKIANGARWLELGAGSADRRWWE